MDHSTRLYWAAKITYYAGWIALLCGGLAHIGIATRFFMAIRLPQRNLFEFGVACFVICIASELRTREAAGSAITSASKKAA
jgi:hypothetical protein